MNIFSDWRTKFFNLMCLEGEGGGGGGEGGDPKPNSDPNPEPKPADKTFTQDDVNRIIAAEKHKNQNSVYKALGFESSEEAKEFVEKYKKQEDDKKDELTKAQERTAALEKEKADETHKAQMVEYKFKVVEEGCDPKNAGDVVTLAVGRMSDDKDFEAALKEVKESYPTMFESSSSKGGTGSGGNPPRPGKPSGGESSGLGKRLAEQRKNGVKKTSFFQN